MDEKISIIVPMYNVELYLRKCINSILNQTYKNIEIILVDDGSPDNSGKIADAFAKMDSRIKVIHQENRGLCGARNAGLEVATGKYIGFIDSDDWISIDCLQLLFEACQQNDAQIALSDYVMAYDYKENINYSYSKNERIVFDNRKALDYYAEFSIKKNYAQFRSPWGKLIKREIVLKKQFPTDRVYAEDAACVYLWIWNSQTVVHCSFYGYYYYQPGVRQRRAGARQAAGRRPGLGLL